MNNDLISRSELKKAVTKWFIDERYYNPLDKPENMTESMLLSFINNAPAIKPERPQGTWDYEQVALYGVCSNCGVAVTSNLADMFLYEEIGKCPYNTNFCPNCGADMRKGGAE